jgi:protein O-GlcNAc transferase
MVSFARALLSSGAERGVEPMREQAMRSEAAAASAEPLPPAEVIRQSMALAARAHAEGDLIGAETLYGAILAVDPNHADALHGIGVIAHQAGRGDLAELFLRRALDRRSEATFHNNLALVLLGLGKPHEAVAHIFNALALRPDYPEAQVALGNVQMKLGRRDEAIESYRRALALRPAYAEARVNLGKAFQDNCQFDATQAEYEAALAINPACAEAHNNLGNVLRCKGRLDEALARFEAALSVRPAYAEAHANRAAILIMRADHLGAIAALNCALALRPDFPEALTLFGSALVGLGRFDEATLSLRRAIALDPDNVAAHNNLGSILLQLQQIDEAITEFETAISLSDEAIGAESRFNLGTTLMQRNCLDQAIDVFEKALETAPDHVGLRNNLGVALQDKGEVEEAVAQYDRALLSSPDYAAACSNRLMAMNYVERYSNDDILAAARAFGALFSRPAPDDFTGRDLSPERRLRIGYVSGDFNCHPVAFFIERSLIAHDRAQVEVFCYSNCAAEDFVTERLKTLCDHWRLVVAISDEELAAAIRADGIDILVDLAGHTNKTRISVFGLKPAPVQAAWLGYFGTTGLPAMDYLILDPVSAPPGAERWYTESIVRLPYGRFCYRTPPFGIEPGDPPCLKKGYPTFGSFNNVTKLTPAVLALWAEVLAAVPDARLLLKWRTLSEDSVRTRLIEEFAGRGVAPERLELRGASGYEQMFAEYDEIDVALDPFPFGGATTSCEALWMGVPVVTLPGERLASRQTLGFLHYMGFDEFAAASRAEYVARAAALAGAPERLKLLRKTLRPATESAPFCDGAKFTATLEQAYRTMWRCYVAGEAPAAFDVAPL